MGFKSTILVVADVLKSRELYEHVLECKVKGNFGICNVGFEGGLALYNKALFSELTGHEDIVMRARNLAVYFEFDDISEKERTLESMRFDFVHKTREQPWGQRAFRFYDIDGHIVEVGERMNAVFKRLHASGLPHQEIAKITGCPETDICDEITRIENGNHNTRPHSA